MCQDTKTKPEKGFRLNRESLKLTLFSLTLLGLVFITACGGGGGDESSSGIQTREVTGIVNEGTAKNTFPGGYKKNLFALYVYKLFSPHSAIAVGQTGTFIVTAIGRDGSIHEADTDLETGSFTFSLPVDNCYTMSFTAHMGPGMMDEFWDYMVFQCGPGQEGALDNQFCLPSGDTPVDLGIITVHSDHRFAMPTHNPLEIVDSDDDGVIDFQDPDYVCGNVEDMNHDGYYDDDSDRDGHHDDDMDFDGFHDDDMNHDGFHDGMGHR